MKINGFDIDVFKIDGVVAAFAIAPEAAVVFVIGGMTAITIARQFHPIRRFAMAIGTRRFCVFTGERKLRFRVIEQHAFPTFGGVTGIAFSAERAFMLVVFFMAGNATRRCTFESRADMTTFARHHRVQTR